MGVHRATLARVTAAPTLTPLELKKYALELHNELLHTIERLESERLAHAETQDQLLALRQRPRYVVQGFTHGGARARIEDYIIDLGGEVIPTLAREDINTSLKHITHCCVPKGWKIFTTRALALALRGVQLCDEEYITRCVENNTFLPHDAHSLRIPTEHLALPETNRKRVRIHIADLRDTRVLGPLFVQHGMDLVSDGVHRTREDRLRPAMNIRTAGAERRLLGMNAQRPKCLSFSTLSDFLFSLGKNSLSDMVRKIEGNG